MKTISKVSILLLMLVGLIVVKGRTATMTLAPGGASGPVGMSFNTVTSSGQVFLRGGTLYALLLSTGPTGDWVVPIDTVVPAGGSAFASFQSTQTICPQISFSSALASGGQFDPYTNRVNWYPYGVRIQNGLYFYMPSGNNTGDKVTGYYYK